MQEIKEEMKVMITQISDYQVEQAVSVIKKQIRFMESENEMDKKRIVERFEKSIENLTNDFQNTVEEVRHKFDDDLRHLHRMRARDKSDNENTADYLKR